MKKLVFAALAIIGAQFSGLAQDTATDTIEKRQWYVGFGYAGHDGFKINDNLEAAGMPQIGDGGFEVSIGRNVMCKNMLWDLEWNTAYNDKKTSTDRIRTVTSGIKLRAQYMPWKTDKFFLAGGADLSYIFNRFDLYSRGNEIDFDDLDPSTHTGHIALSNNQLYIGPSIAFGAFHNSDFPIRLNFGYEWAVYSSKWESPVASVNNTFRENGQGRFYVRLTLPL